MSHGCPETHYCSLPGESLLLFLGKANCDGVVPACSLISSYRWWNFYGMLSRQRLFAGVGCCRWHTSPQIFVSSKELNHAYNKTQTDRQAGRQASRQAGRQAGRQTDRQRVREGETVLFTSTKHCPTEIRNNTLQCKAKQSWASGQTLLKPRTTVVRRWDKTDGCYGIRLWLHSRTVPCVWGEQRTLIAYKRQYTVPRWRQNLSYPTTSPDIILSGWLGSKHQQR